MVIHKLKEPVRKNDVQNDQGRIEDYLELNRITLEQEKNHFVSKISVN
jgi:hypothetical protein